MKVTLYRLNGSPSSFVSGVPQGSILGPLPFIFYINGIIHSLTIATLSFAQTTSLSLNLLMVMSYKANMPLKKFTKNAKQKDGSKMIQQRRFGDGRDLGTGVTQAVFHWAGTQPNGKRHVKKGELILLTAVNSSI